MAQRPREALVAGLGDVMVVLAVAGLDVQREAGVLREGVEPLAESSVSISPSFGRENATFHTRCGRPETSMATRVSVSSIGSATSA